MKFYIFSLAFLCSIVFAPISFGHEIHLKNGRTIQTETYWEDEKFLYYEKYGATLKISKSNIDKIGGATQDTEIEVFVNSIGMEFVKIPPGTFLMGVGEDLKEVTLTKGFYMQTTEVTRDHWNTIGEEMTGRLYKRENIDHPIRKVNWDEILRFIQHLNRMEETNKYRLPTEAEWEYACKAGTTTRFNWGDMQNYKKECDPIDCTKANYGVSRNDGHNCILDPCFRKNPGRPMKVKSFPPNNWGLYDMHGNVGEVCQDYYWSHSVRPLAEGNLIDPMGPTEYSSDGRVVRGGNFSSASPFQIQSGRRSSGGGYSDKRVGFRIVIDLE